MYASRPSIHLVSLAAAVLVSLGVVSALSQAMRIDRFGEGARTVSLDAVVITARQALTATTMAQTERATRAN